MSLLLVSGACASKASSTAGDQVPPLASAEGEVEDEGPAASSSQAKAELDRMLDYPNGQREPQTFADEAKLFSYHFETETDASTISAKMHTPGC